MMWRFPLVAQSRDDNAKHNKADEIWYGGVVALKSLASGDWAGRQGEWGLSKATHRYVRPRALLVYKTIRGILFIEVIFSSTTFIAGEAVDVDLVQHDAKQMFVYDGRFENSMFY